MIARRRNQLIVPQDEAGEDLASLSAEVTEEANDAIQDLLRRPDWGDPKDRRLEGCLSWAFGDGGRIVYEWDEDYATVTLVSVDDDHERAYAKAKARRKRSR